MISAGYIGGGEPVAPPAPAEPQVAVQTPRGYVQQPAFSQDQVGSMPQDQRGAYWRAQTSLVENAAASLAPTPWYQDPAVIGGISNLGNQVFSWLTNIRFFDMQETINDRRALAGENISDDRKEVELRWLETQDKISRRTDGPGGTRERLARIEANRDVEMYQIRSRTQREIAATRGLDQAFSMRSEYNYGTPYSPYA